MSITEDHSCGGCTACCYTHSVREVSTPIGKNCRYCITGDGCAIYDARPQACSYYKCWWLKSCITSERMRPDRIGFVVDDWKVPDEELMCINLWEVEPGSTDSDIGQLLVQNFLHTKKAVVLCITSGDKKLKPHFPDGVTEPEQERYFKNLIRLIDADGKL